MAPITPISGASVSQGTSVGPRSPQTVHIVGLPSTQNISVGGSSTQKLPNASISTIRNTHLLGSTSTRKISTDALSTTRTTDNAGRSTTLKPAVVGTSTLQSNSPSRPVTNAVGSTTTRRVPVVTGQSPGGIHPSHSTHLPPISQGQHGTTSGGNESANTTTIIAGVLVPLILIGVGALIVYIWYRRKYPVRMVLGRDFNRFSNPAYNKRASTLTLVRNDGQTEWDTLSRRNPDLSVVNEDDRDGIENQAFEYEKDENNGDGSAEKRVEVDVVTSSTDRKEIEGQTEIIPNMGISRDRPKTKKAVLVKTSTMEDLENGFELVTESDLGQRTESEVSSGNDSTETHTISLTFSETFDERHKEDQRHSDMCEEEVEKLDVNDREINDSEKDNNSSFSIMDGVVDKSESVDKDQTMNNNELDEKDIGSQNNESFEVIVDDQLSTSIESKRQTGSENDTDTTQLPTEVPVEETVTIVNYDSVVEAGKLKSSVTINNSDSNVIDTSNRSPINEISELSNDVNGDVKQQESFLLLQRNGNSTVVNRQFESVDEHRDDSRINSIKAESNADQTAFESFRDDSSFEILSDSGKVKFENVNLTQDIDKYQDDMTQNEMNVLEKEKTEILEKQKTLERNNNLGTVSSVDIEHSHSDVSVDETDSQKELVQRKLPPLNLSNENIVLDSIPQTPTVFVQESFILENESSLPVYLDNTNISSPVRGRRAFTLNDIISKNSDDGVSSEFSLPKGKDNISKSSPVISELKTPKFKSFEKEHFEFDNKNDNGKDVTEDSAKISLDLTSNNTKAFEMYPDKNEEEKHILNAQEIHETVKINDTKDSMSGFDAFDSIENYGLEKNSHVQKDVLMENAEMFTSLNSDSSEFGREKPNDFNLGTSAENSNFNDISTDPFSVILAGIKSDETLDHEKTHSLDKDYDGDKLDSLNLFTANFTSDKTSEREPSQTKNKANGNGEITSEDILDEDNPFFSSFPQSSTPTASVIAESRTDSNEDPQKKKVLPQAFDFEDLCDNDNDSSISESSSDTSEVQVINDTTSGETFDEHNKSLGAFETEAFATSDPTEEKGNTTQHTGDSSAADDVFSLTRSTDSSTALSWEILSRENSLDSRSNDHFDIPNSEQNAPELSDFSVNKNQDNESHSVSEKAGMFDFIPDMSKQSATNNTSIGSSGTAEISWEIVNEEGDNSEC